MTEVYFIRHAEPDISEHDEMKRGLTENGMRDAAALCAYFNDIQIDSVFASPYRRAIDTVAGIAQTHGLTVNVIEDFRERRIADDWIPDFAQFVQRQWRDFDYCLLGGESLRMVQRRNVNALMDVLQSHPGERMVIGTHGTALSTIINYYDSTFDGSAFMRIKNLMPWTVKFTFSGTDYVRHEEIKT